MDGWDGDWTLTESTTSTRSGDDIEPSPEEIANYQLGTVFYDHRVSEEAQRQITDIVDRLTKDLKEQKNEK